MPGMDWRINFGMASKLLPLFVALSLLSWASASTPVSSSQIPALMSLKASLQGSKDRLNSWNESNNCSDWLGLKCDDSGLVIEINLYALGSYVPFINYQIPGFESPFGSNYTLGKEQLTGSLDDSIGNLTSLKRLYISGNRLSGGIPASIGNLVNLEILDLGSNFLTGNIPASISQLSNLRLLFLPYNLLTGTIPNWIGSLSNLVSLDLSSNYLNGSVPDSFSNLTNLVLINLGSNDFSRSTFPSWISNFEHLKYLDFRADNLNGTIPDLSKLSNLTYIDLSFNGLTGSIITQFSNLNALTTIILSANSLSGPLSPVFGNLPLGALDLSKNKIYGGIPSDFGRLGDKLFILDLAQNQLNGTIPSTISNLSAVASIYLGSNHLIGSIPESITTMSHLYDFYVDGNFLTGQIPLNIGNLTSLNNLVLSNNLLYGPLPNNISQLNQLGVLMLDNNSFSGQMPPEFGDLLNLVVFDASQNIFTGIIPPTFGNLLNLTNLRLFQNSLQGPIPDLSNLTKLLELDLSLNALSGPVPDNLSPSLVKLNLRSNFLSGSVPDDFLERLENLTTLDLSSNQLTNVPSFNNTSNSLSFISLASTQFSTGKAPSNITRGTQIIQIFGKECTVTNVSCFKQYSDYVDNSDICINKCNGLEKVNPVLYVNMQNCPCSPPLIVAINLYAPLFYIFNGNESSNVEKYFAGVTELPEIQVKVSNATATVNGQVTFTVFLLFFTNNTEKWSVRNYNEILTNLYARQGRRDNPRIGPYRIVDFIVTDKGVPPSSTSESDSSGVKSWVVILVTCVSAFFVLVVVICAILFVRMNGGPRKLGKLEEDVMNGMARAVSLAEVQQATKYFSEDLLLGAGGFGSVYKGVSKNGTIWAVKRAKKVSLQSKVEFENEVLAIARMDHVNLVKLLGYCDEQNEQILIYEFMDKGTLRNALDPTRAGVTRPVLTFDERLHIAVGAACGLNYLHSGATQPIIHRDIKSENILLDSNLTAKVADFGLLKKNAKDDIETSENTKLAGTPGYMDPEYYTTYKVTTKSDVYSFGIVLLELLTGKAPVMQDRSTIRSKYDQDAVSMITVARWAVPQIETGKITDIIDPLLEGNFDPRAAEAFAHVSFACVRKLASQRPDMAIVTARLREILEAVRTGADLTIGQFSVAPSESDSHILEPPIPSTPNSVGSTLYPPSDINYGR